MAYEFNMLNKVGITDEMLDQFTLNSIDAAFISEAEKEALRKQLTNK
jgi:adenosine deaminase